MCDLPDLKSALTSHPAIISGNDEDSRMISPSVGNLNKEFLTQSPAKVSSSTYPKSHGRGIEVPSGIIAHVSFNLEPLPHDSFLLCLMKYPIENVSPPAASQRVLKSLCASVLRC